MITNDTRNTNYRRSTSILRYNSYIDEEEEEMNDVKEKVTVIDGRYARCQIMHINNILSLVEKSIINDEGNENPIENIENTIDALTEEITNLKYRYKYTIERSVKEEE